MNEQRTAVQVIESLRREVPPQRGVDLYAVGNEKLIDGTKRFHLSGISDRGIIRFISGSWGAGKTHFFRLLREVAFQHDCLISNVELNVNDAALNRFERVFYSIVRNVVTPSYYTSTAAFEAAPFGSAEFQRILRTFASSTAKGKLFILLLASFFICAATPQAHAGAGAELMARIPYLEIQLAALLGSVAMVFYLWFRRQFWQQRSHEFKEMHVKLKRSEAALRGSDERHVRLVQAIPDIVYKIDPEGIFVFVNNSIRQLGYEPEELIGKHFSVILHPHDVARVSRALVLAEHVGRITGEEEAPKLFDERRGGQRMTKNLEVRLIPMSPSPEIAFGSVYSYGEIVSRGQFDYVTPQDKHFLGTVGIIRDISERKKMEEERDATRARTIQQERLHALGEMASGIAHDFNNALAPIVGFSELLLMNPDSLDDREHVMRRLQIINTAGKDAANVVGRLREFYRQREAGEVFVPVDLNEMAQQTIGLTQPKWKDEAQAKGITVKIETQLNEIPCVAGSEPELREMLTNLIFNAVDAMPQGGTITLRAQCEGERVLLAVTDTGAGMTEQVLQHCLEPFFTTKGTRGTGLGLAMVAGIIRRHEGTIDLETAPGTGTTFTISLPVYREPERTWTAEGAATASRPLRVLVVDDEPLVMQVTVELLASDGHTVETAGNGIEALQQFQTKYFDLVMTDRAMPEMNGDQLAATIKQMAPGKPIILITGFGDLMESTGECPPGVDSILGKPITMAKLREAIAMVTKEG